MTKQELMTAFEMRIGGYSYEEIGDKLCYSASHIHDTLQRICQTNAYTKRKLKYNEYTYPNLVQTILEEYASISNFCAINGLYYNTVRNALKGKHKPNSATVNKLVERTGRTAEYLFTAKE